ncbi:hypothetical protein JCM8547_000312 [Rhodosporidiobolus lusitaniae]
MSTLGQPSSLDAALSRIRFLEQQLDNAHKVVREHYGADLSALLDGQRLVPRATTAGATSSSSLSSSFALPALSASLSTLGTAPSSSATPAAEEETAKEPIDIAPLVLRAIQLRKDLHQGKVEDSRGEEELQNILGSMEGLSEEQRMTVTRWAGLD